MSAQLPLLFTFAVIPQDRITSLPGAPEAATLGHYAGLLNVSHAGLPLSTFYYYAQHADSSKPLLVWMNGGPGASSLMGLFTELGPLLLNDRSLPRSTNGTDWRLQINPEAWSIDSSLLVWEQPAGVGFSRCVQSTGCPPWDDATSAAANLDVLLEFLRVYPEAASRDVYISGESYGGIYVPLLAESIMKHNARTLPPHATQHAIANGPIRLRGIAVGNGCIGFGVTGGCGLDALDLFVTSMETAAQGVPRAATSHVRDACAPEELMSGKAPAELSASCAAALRALAMEVGSFNVYHLASACGASAQGNWGDGSGFACAGGADGGAAVDGGVLAEYLAMPQTQRALHVISDGQPPLTWQAWDGTMPGYNISIPDVQPAYRALLAGGVRTLIYNGLRDTGVPVAGAERWVPRVAGTALAQGGARRKWGAPPKGQYVAGDVTQYATGLTFATVEGAGHLVPADRPEATRAMMAAWLRSEPLPAYGGAACTPVWLGRGWGDLCS